MYVPPIRTLPDVCEARLAAKAFEIRADDLREMVLTGELPGVAVGRKVLVAPKILNRELLKRCKVQG